MSSQIVQWEATKLLNKDDIDPCRIEDSVDEVGKEHESDLRDNSHWIWLPLSKDQDHEHRSSPKPDLCMTSQKMGYQTHAHET